MSLSDNLRKLRNSLNLTQEQVSADLKMNRATYAHYETGRREPDIETLKLIAKYYNVTSDYLLDIDDTESSASSKKTFETNIEKQNIVHNKLSKEIDNLSPESQEELKKYIELLKLKDMKDRNSETADELANFD